MDVLITGPPLRRTRGGFSSIRLCHTVGVQTADAGPIFELKPCGIAGVTTDRTANPPTRTDSTGAVGLAAKYGITQNLTADFTVNTDFAQVEVDEQQVNLTRFSLFFPEKREFLSLIHI